MKTIYEISPGVQLSGIVSHYSYKEINIQQAIKVPAYKEQFLEFYLTGTYTVINWQNNTSFTSPPAIFIGQPTSRNWDLIIEGQYKMFVIHFEPTGFNRFFNLPMKEFTDKATDPSLGCTIVVPGTKRGYWHVDDNNTLYPDKTYYHLKATDDCNPVYNMDKNLTLSHIKYVCQLAADEYGNPNLHLATTSGMTYSANNLLSGCSVDG